MTKTPDFTKTFENMFQAFPTDLTAFNDVFKTSAEFTSKLAKITLEAAEKNAELSQAWTRDTLGKFEAATDVQKDASDYSKVFSDIASSQAQAAPEHIAAFAEVAKKAQMDTVELMMEAGKDVQKEVTAVAKKATKKAA